MTSTLGVTENMTARHYMHYLLPIPQAASLASLGGVAADLEGVITYCKYLNDHGEIEKLNFVVWEAMSAAAVVRYARCFGKGVREPLPRSFFHAAPAAIKEAHDYFLAVRSKHVAHSVNDFEENDLVIQVGSDYVSSSEIVSVHSNHSRLIGLAFSDPDRLIEVAEWALQGVRQLIQDEERRLLPIVHGLPFATVKAFGVAELGRGRNRAKVSARRRRP